MNLKDVSIATISWARDQDEEQLLRDSLQLLAATGIPVHITDGGSPAPFTGFLEGFPHFSLLQPPARGLWPQARTSIQAAYEGGSPFIFYTEPDKLHFFREQLLPLLDAAAADEKTGIVLAARSEKGFVSFPAFQKKLETTINQCCAEVIGQQVDYTYGPFLMSRQLVPYLSSLPDDIGWGWRPYAFNLAKRLGYEVKAFEADFSCPPDQQEDNPEERLYRMRQLTQNIEGLLLSTKVMLNLNSMG